MRPASGELSAFERAILELMGSDRESLRPLVPRLQVLKREFTGAGSYTDLACPESAPDLGDGHIGIDVLINVPGVPNGMGAVLFCKAGAPKLLEIYTFGGESWNGIADGFFFSRGS
jgi:hypothetical protein